MGLSSLPRSHGPLSSSFLFYLVHRYDVFLCNEESKNSIEDLTCFRTFTALHWKGDVSKEPFQFILETCYQSKSSIGVSAVINGPAKRLLLQIGAKKARQRRAHAFLFNLFLCAIFHKLNFAKLCHSASHTTFHSANSFRLLPSPGVISAPKAKHLDVTTMFTY